MAWERFPGGPVSSSSSPDNFAPVLLPLKDGLIGSVASLLWILLGGTGVVLLIACANVANLFLVRAEWKEAEMAVRSAMGATGNRILWEYLRESLLLGGLGGIGGLALAFAALRVLAAVGPTQLPRLQEVSLSPTVVLFTLTVSLGSGIFFGALPGLRRVRVNLVDALRQGGGSGMGGRGRHRIQNVLAVSQMALALVLLVASGLMLRSMQALLHVDPGFHDAETLIALRLTIPSSEIPDTEEAAATFELIARRLAE